MIRKKSLAGEYLATVERSDADIIVGRTEEFDPQELIDLPLSRLFIFVDKNWIYSLADHSETHGFTVGGIDTHIENCLSAQCSDPSTKFFCASGGHETLVENTLSCHTRFTMQPDGTYYYLAGRRDSPPTIVLEVAVWNEPLELLLVECSTLLNEYTSYVYCIGVKYLRDRIIFFVCETTIAEKYDELVCSPRKKLTGKSEYERFFQKKNDGSSASFERSFKNHETQEWQDHYNMKVTYYDEVTEARDIVFDLDLEKISIIDGEPQEHGTATITIPRKIVQLWMNVWEKARAQRNPIEE